MICHSVRSIGCFDSLQTAPFSSVQATPSSVTCLSNCSHQELLDAHPRERKPILLPFLVTTNTASAGKYGSLTLPVAKDACLDCKVCGAKTCPAWQVRGNSLTFTGGGAWSQTGVQHPSFIFLLDCNELTQGSVEADQAASLKGTHGYAFLRHV